MIWKFVQACSAGRSHIENDEDCQDECLAYTSDTPDGEEYFIALVSDGAGSASNGGDGAAVACAMGSIVIEKWIREAGFLSDITPEVLKDRIAEIRQHICQEAESKKLTPRDFACTLLGGIVSLKIAVFFQVGDGAIVINDGDDLRPVFWPEKGEYDNMTYFITDEDVSEHIQIEVSVSPPDEIAIFSDGLQRLALVYHSKTAYKPFFEPMFDTLRKVSDRITCYKLSEQLIRFLDSPKINERTDDDKSLVLATRRYYKKEEFII